MSKKILSKDKSEETPVLTAAMIREFARSLRGTKVKPGQKVVWAVSEETLRDILGESNVQEKYPQQRED